MEDRTAKLFHTDIPSMFQSCMYDKIMILFAHFVFMDALTLTSVWITWIVFKICDFVNGLCV